MFWRLCNWRTLRLNSYLLLNYISRLFLLNFRLLVCLFIVFFRGLFQLLCLDCLFYIWYISDILVRFNSIVWLSHLWLILFWFYFGDRGFVSQLWFIGERESRLLYSRPWRRDDFLFTFYRLSSVFNCFLFFILFNWLLWGLILFNLRPNFLLDLFDRCWSTKNFVVLLEIIVILSTDVLMLNISFFLVLPIRIVFFFFISDMFIRWLMWFLLYSFKLWILMHI